MLNASQRLVNKTRLTWWYIFKTSWRCLQDVFARRLEDVLKTSWRHLENVLKTSWRRLENVLKTSWRRMDKTNILVLTKTSWRRWLIRIYSSSSRRLEGVLKKSFEDEDERRPQDAFIKTNVCWVWNIFAILINLLLFSQCGFSRNKSIEAVLLKSLCWSLFLCS